MYCESSVTTTLRSRGDGRLFTRSRRCRIRLLSRNLELTKRLRVTRESSTGCDVEGTQSSHRKLSPIKRAPMPIGSNDYVFSNSKSYLRVFEYIDIIIPGSDIVNGWVSNLVDLFREFLFPCLTFWKYWE